MEQDLKKLLDMLDRMTKFAATFMVVAVDQDFKEDMISDVRLHQFKGVGAEAVAMHKQLSAKYPS